MKIILLLTILALITLRLAIPRMGSSVAGGVIDINGELTLAECPSTPNCHLDEFPIQGEVSTAIASMVDVIESQPGAHVVSRNENYIHATFSTRLMGYIDDVEFLLPDTDAPARLLVRSASRLGQKDFGANAKRVDWLRSESLSRL